MPKPPCRKTVGVIFNANPWAGDEGVHTFFKSICPKGNVEAQLEFKLAGYGVEVQMLTTTQREFAHTFVLNHYIQYMPAWEVVVLLVLLASPKLLTT